MRAGNGFYGPMLPIESIAAGIRKAIRDDPARATHGDTRYNAFYVTPMGKVIPADKWMELPRATADEPLPDAVSVHSHSAENWRWYERTSGEKEPFSPLNAGDVQVLQNYVKSGMLNTMALIMADGRMQILHVPETARRGRFAMASKRLITNRVEGTRQQREAAYRSTSKTTAEVETDFLRSFARTFGLDLYEDLRWKPVEEEEELTLFPRRKATRPPVTIWKGKPSRTTAAYKYYTSKYYNLLPPELWPIVPTQPELFRTTARIQRKGTYTFVYPSKREPVQMRFFGARRGADQEPPQLTGFSGTKADLGPDERKVLDAIGEQTVHMDDLQRNTGIPPSRLSAALVMLELKNLVRQKAGKLFETRSPVQMRLLGSGDFSGRVVHCGIWVQDPYTGAWRCGKYGPACQAECVPSGTRPVKIPKRLRHIAEMARRYRDPQKFADQAYQRTFAERSGMPITATHRRVLRDASYRLAYHVAPLTSTQMDVIARYGMKDPGDTVGGKALVQDSGFRDLTQFWRAATGQMLEQRPVEKKQNRVCVTWKLVEPKSKKVKAKLIWRCGGYAASCTAGACLVETMPRPEPEPEPTKEEIRAVAQWMAEEQSEAQALDPKYLAREILDRGGIRAYKKRYPGQPTDEEYMAIPLFLKRKTGLPPDEMAHDMGFESDTELYRAIHAAYPAKTPKTRLQRLAERRKPRWQDFEDRAYNYLMAKRTGRASVW